VTVRFEGPGSDAERAGELDAVDRVNRVNAGDSNAAADV
jgi:hypothetical protein